MQQPRYVYYYVSLLDNEKVWFSLDMVEKIKTRVYTGDGFTSVKRMKFDSDTDFFVPKNAITINKGDFLQKLREAQQSIVNNVVMQVVVMQ